MQQRQHYAVLDGLRGIAAILVLAFHLSEASVTGDASRNLLPHGALAVDFFFCLSGFVIGHAYDRRWASMSLRQFALRRLIRLHPMVIIALIEGLAAFLLRPWRGPHEIVSAGSVALAFIAGLLVLPWRTLPGRGDDTHSLDGPTWTLFQEYIGNIAYALVLRRMPKWVLAVLLVPAAAGLIYGGMFYGTLSKGYGWDGLWMAPVRLAFPFIAGLLLYRVIHHLPARRLGVLPLGLGLAVVFALPVVGGAAHRDAAGLLVSAAAPGAYNGLFEALVVILVFPVLILLGAHSSGGARVNRACAWAGRLSYPLYIIHYPFVYWAWNFAFFGHPQSGELSRAMIATFPVMIVLAAAVMLLYDEPVRRWLGRITARSQAITD